MIYFIFFCVYLLQFSVCVDRSKFKTCEQSGFCRRNRRITEQTANIVPRWKATRPAYTDGDQFSLELHPTDAIAEELNGASPLLVMNITVTTNGIFRLRINEVAPLHQRYEVQDVLLDSVRAVPFSSTQVSADNNIFTLLSSTPDKPFVTVTLEPFAVILHVDGQPAVHFNERNLLHFEHSRAKPVAPQEEKPTGEIEHEERIDDDGDHTTDELDRKDSFENNDDDVTVEDLERVDDDGDVDLKEENFKHEEMLNEDKEEVLKKPVEKPIDERDSWWQESFGSHTDSKPKGPTAISIDISFPSSEHVFGIPEHAHDFSLQSSKRGDTTVSDPYRLYNLDVFEYELNETMALYGAVPMMMAHNSNFTVGVLWLNSAEMWIDVDRSAVEGSVAASSDNSGLGKLWASVTGGTDQRVVAPKERGVATHWMAESGIVDLFLMGAPAARPSAVLQQYFSLTGTPAVPPLFAVAYHQCRWNYRDEKDVEEVTDAFNANGIPFDVLWLDIEHTDGKRYFTWDKHNFGTPSEMLAKLAAQNRRVVTIVDPHLKRDQSYRVHTDALANNVYVRNADNASDFDGWCWPGSSHWPDFTRADVRQWWANLFQYDVYEGSADNLFIWNDMNEPSVFNGPEVTMQKDLLHANGVEHRDVHNAYGMMVHRATAMGLQNRDKLKNRRPFVLSRAFFAGTQRYGAIWTGDNKADWDHLSASVPMLLSLAVAGIPFAGADVGGFFGNPDGELMTRWYQLGAFQPFFRGHAHLDAKRREPYLFDEPFATAMRDAVRLRYQYTLLHQSSLDGQPPMRPLFFEFPSESALFALDDQFLVGNALLVKGVTSANQRATDVVLPNAVWYDVWSGQAHAGGQALQVDTPIDRFPLFQKAGTIVPSRDRVRRSSAAMSRDPFTLLVAVQERADNTAFAQGELIVDDGLTIGCPITHRRFTLVNNLLSNEGVGSPLFVEGNDLLVEKVILQGWKSTPKACFVQVPGQADRSVPFVHKDNVLRVGPLAVAIGSRWMLRIDAQAVHNEL